VYIKCIVCRPPPPAGVHRLRRLPNPLPPRHRPTQRRRMANSPHTWYCTRVSGTVSAKLNDQCGCDPTNVQHNLLAVTPAGCAVVLLRAQTSQSTPQFTPRDRTMGSVVEVTSLLSPQLCCDGIHRDQLGGIHWSGSIGRGPLVRGLSQYGTEVELRLQAELHKLGSEHTWGANACSTPRLSLLA
jgi:hypothetical protein